MTDKEELGNNTVADQGSSQHSGMGILCAPVNLQDHDCLDLF